MHVSEKFEPRGYWRQPPFSLEPGHTVFMDFIGPVKVGRGGVKHIFCVVDSCTRMGGAWKYRTTESRNVIKGLNNWNSQYGKMKQNRVGQCCILFFGRDACMV